MSFEFECPNGHVLEAEENQQGDECECPVCGTAFFVPSAPTPEPEPPAEVPVELDFSKPRELALLSIPCPNGHVLETPREQLDTDAACPHCAVIFRLRETDSFEYQEKQRIAEELRERKLARAWLNWAIAIALVVIFGVGILILSASRR